MKELFIHSGEVVHKVFVCNGLGACCSEDLSISKYNCEIPARVVVERGGRVDIVVLIMPGVSEDLRVNVELVGEEAEANIYGAYVCGADERVKIAVDMHHKVPHCNSRQLFKGKPDVY